MANDFNFNGDDNSSYHKTVALCVAAASLVVLLFLVALYVKSDNKKTAKAKVDALEEVQEENVLDEAHNFTSDELEFWNSTNDDTFDKKKDPEGEVVSYKSDDTDKETSSGADEKTSDKKEGDFHKIEEESEDIEEGDKSMNNKIDDDPSENDGKLAVTDSKGTKKYYEILSDVSKNNYDFDEYLLNEEGTLSYKDEKREATLGIDLSKYNGNVDFSKVKASGIEFAMLRLGSRGYGTGIISLDEKFVEYAQNAVLNNIPIGAYFYSQAITEAEAIEEANYIVGAVGSFTIKYPIAIDIESVAEDDARTENLTVKERTAIAKAFCDTVKGFGYKPCIYADRDMLVAGLDLKELDGYDIWLSDNSIPTDYPYKFTMWQYTNKGRVDGVDGDVDLNLGFVNYEQR